MPTLQDCHQALVMFADFNATTNASEFQTEADACKKMIKKFNNWSMSSIRSAHGPFHKKSSTSRER